MLLEARQLHHAQLDYRRTRVYARCMEQAQAGTPVWRNQMPLRTPEQIQDYFERFVALFESIKAQGVRPIGRLTAAESARFGPSPSRRWKTQWGERDIGVALGPDGQMLLLPGGKHRWSVATVLKLSHVPAQVRMVHVDWLRQLPRRPGQSRVNAVAEGLAAVRQQHAQG